MTRKSFSLFLVLSLALAGFASPLSLTQIEVQEPDAELLFQPAFLAAVAPLCAEQTMGTTTSFTEECAECIQACMENTGYSGIVCRNAYCEWECND